MTTPIDIRADHLRIVQDVLARHLPGGVKVWVFGSRATWATKDSSDLDLALEGDGEIPARSLSALESAFEDSDLPYTVDVVDTRRISARFRKIVKRQRVPLPMSSSHRNLSGSAHDDADRAAPTPGRPAATVPDPGRQADAVTDDLEDTHREVMVATLAANDRRRSCATLPSGTTHPRGLPPAESIHWPLVPARDFFKLTYGRALAAPYRRPGSVPVYGTNGRCGTHDVALFDGPGVVLGRKGQGPLGVEWSRGPYWVIDTAYTLTPLRPDVHLKFAYYLLKLIGLNHLKDGTSNPTLSRETFGAQALPFPPVSSQRAIANILGTLDDKIELNRRMNATLEAMARALFRSWFVDFDPVRAKVEDRDTGLPKETADLFPDRLVGSELGEIPEGWESARLHNVATITKGRSYRRRELVTSDTALVTLKSFARGGGYRAEGLKPFSGAYKSEQVVHPGEVIVACTDVTQAAEVVGRSAVVGASSFRTLVASLDVLIVRPRDAARGRTFVHYVTGTESFVAHALARTTGTTVLHLSKDAVASFPFALPPRRLTERFGHFADSLRARIQANASAVELLVQLRDTLLPKLVSGELRVRDAEKVVGASA